MSKSTVLDADQLPVKKPRKKTGPPVGKYAVVGPDKHAEVCTILATESANKRGLTGACELAGVTPAQFLYFTFRTGNEGYAIAYAKAKEIYLERIGEELIELADTADMKNYKAVAVRVDARKWVLSRLLPKYKEQSVSQQNITVTKTPYEERLRKLRGMPSPPKLIDVKPVEEEPPVVDNDQDQGAEGGGKT